MAFKMQSSRTFLWPVRFTLPSTSKAGEIETHGFVARFRQLDVEAHRALVKRALEERWTVDLFVVDLVLDVTDVLDEQGIALTYSPELFGRLCQVPGVADAIAAAYLEALVPADEAALRKVAAAA